MLSAAVRSSLYIPYLYSGRVLDVIRLLIEPDLFRLIQEGRRVLVSSPNRGGKGKSFLRFVFPRVINDDQLRFSSYWNLGYTLEDPNQAQPFFFLFLRAQVANEGPVVVARRDSFTAETLSIAGKGRKIYCETCPL